MVYEIIPAVKQNTADIVKYSILIRGASSESGSFQVVADNAGQVLEFNNIPDAQAYIDTYLGNIDINSALDVFHTNGGFPGLTAFFEKVSKSDLTKALLYLTDVDEIAKVTIMRDNYDQAKDFHDALKYLNDEYVGS